MRKRLVQFASALVTIIGLTLSSVVNAPIALNSLQPVVQTEELLCKPQPQEVIPSESDEKIQRYSDLSIVVEVSPNPDPMSHERRYINLAKRGPTIMDLDLAESIDAQEVTLNFPGNEEYQVLQQYRTTMTISLEGPHIDLVNWRHFVSPWVSLKRLGPKQFQTLALDQIDYSKFPPTTNAQIMKEVRRRVGKTWPAVLELVKDCDGPDDGACIVSISSIYLRIQKKVGTRWKNIGLVEVRIPLGC